MSSFVNKLVVAQRLELMSSMFFVSGEEVHSEGCGARAQELSGHSQAEVFTWWRNSNNNRMIQVAQLDFSSCNPTFKIPVIVQLSCLYARKLSDHSWN